MFLDDTACNLASLNLLTFQNDDGTLDVDGVRARRPAVDDRARDLGDDGAVPVAPHRPALLRLPHAGARLRQPRRLPDGGRHPLRLGGGAPALRRDHRADDRRPPMPPRPRWRPSSAPSRASPRTASAMLRVIRNHRRAAHGEAAGYESLSVPPVPLDASRCPRRGAGRGGARRLGSGAGAGRGARLPQRAGHGDRADRHDRPGDGLRHHRHRARLRAGQVQEAGRRRLLQDHQPDGAARRWRRLGYGGDEIERIVAYAVGHGTLARCAGDQPRGAARQGLHRRGDRRRRAGAGGRLRHPLRLQQVDAGRALLRRAPRHRRRARWTIPASTCSRRSASPATRSRRRTSTSAAR